MAEATRNEQRMKPAAKRPWVSPTIKTSGTVAEVLRNGTAKVSILTGDPGEALKNTHMG